MTSTLSLNPRTLIMGCSLFWILASCSFVEPKPGAEHVILSNDLENCRSLAETEVSVRDTFLLWERGTETIRQELETLAQNEALRLNGNAIWPLGPVEQGRQRYRILRCS
jgi:hypothetical protein